MGESPPPPYPKDQPQPELHRYDTQTSQQPDPSTNATDTVLIQETAIVTSNGVSIRVVDPPGQQPQPVASFIAANVAKTSPVLLQCPFCSRVVTTETNYQAGWLTWVTCWLCMFAGGVAGCCLVPFCIGSFQDVRHVCPQCRQTVAVYTRI